MRIKFRTSLFNENFRCQTLLVILSGPSNLMSKQTLFTSEQTQINAVRFTEIFFRVFSWQGLTAAISYIVFAHLKQTLKNWLAFYGKALRWFYKLSPSHHSQMYTLFLISKLILCFLVSFFAGICSDDHNASANWCN